MAADINRLYSREFMKIGESFRLLLSQTIPQIKLVMKIHISTQLLNRLLS